MRARVLVRFMSCSYGGLMGHVCCVEQFQDNGVIEGYGQIIRQCDNHKGIPREELISILESEARERREARLAAPADKVLALSYEGKGRARRLVKTLLDRIIDA